MFNWVVKVVPHPPGELEEEDAPAANGSSSKEAKTRSVTSNDGDHNSVDSGGQTGMLTWLSSALPQPAGHPDAKSIQDEGLESRQGGGVIGWISQGLGKVVPQPDDKYKKDDHPPEDVTEIYDAKELPDAELLPHIPVVELFSEEESEVESIPSHFPPSVLDWIKNSVENAIPQHRPPGYIETPPRRMTPSSEKVYSPPPESLTSTLDEELKSSTMVGWIVQGLGRMMPQPVYRMKEIQEENGDMASGGRALRAP